MSSPFPPSFLIFWLLPPTSLTPWPAGSPVAAHVDRNRCGWWWREGRGLAAFAAHFRRNHVFFNGCFFSRKIRSENVGFLLLYALYILLGLLNFFSQFDDIFYCRNKIPTNPFLTQYPHSSSFYQDSSMAYNHPSAVQIIFFELFVSFVYIHLKDWSDKLDLLEGLKRLGNLFETFYESYTRNLKLIGSRLQILRIPHVLHHPEFKMSPYQLLFGRDPKLRAQKKYKLIKD